MYYLTRGLVSFLLPYSLLFRGFKSFKTFESFKAFKTFKSY